MSLATKSQGVRRLSIVGGIAGAITIIELARDPYPPTIGTPEFWLDAAFGFLLGWLCVRLVPESGVKPSTPLGCQPAAAPLRRVGTPATRHSAAPMTQRVLR